MYSRGVVVVGGGGAGGGGSVGVGNVGGGSGWSSLALLGGMCCGYSLGAHRRGAACECPQQFFFFFFFFFFLWGGGGGEGDGGVVPELSPGTPPWQLLWYSERIS